MSLGVNDEEVLHLRSSYLFPGWTDRNFDTYFRWLANFPDLKVLRFLHGVDYGDGIRSASVADLLELCAAATRAGVRLIPQLLHPGGPQKAKYTLGTPGYANLVAVERSIMAAFEYEPAIAAWDLCNELDVGGPFLGPAGYAPWVRSLVRDVRTATTKPLTVGHQGFGGGLWDFSSTTFGLMNDVPGMDLSHVHWYGPDSNLSNTLNNYLQIWARALGKPCVAGEYGSNGKYWPEFASLWTAGDAIAMYLAGHPGYPPAGPVNLPPSPPPPPLPSSDLEARLKAVETWVRGHTYPPPLP